MEKKLFFTKNVLVPTTINQNIFAIIKLNNILIKQYNLL